MKHLLPTTGRIGASTRMYYCAVCNLTHVICPRHEEYCFNAGLTAVCIIHRLLSFLPDVRSMSSRFNSKWRNPLRDCFACGLLLRFLVSVPSTGMHLPPPRFLTQGANLCFSISMKCIPVRDHYTSCRQPVLCHFTRAVSSRCQRIWSLWQFHLLRRMLDGCRGSTFTWITTREAFYILAV